MHIHIGQRPSMLAVTIGLALGSTTAASYSEGREDRDRKLKKERGNTFRNCKKIQEITRARQRDQQYVILEYRRDGCASA